jgi:hypothetical protein
VAHERAGRGDAMETWCAGATGASEEGGGDGKRNQESAVGLGVVAGGARKEEGIGFVR